MHEPIKDNLEEYLLRSDAARLPAEFSTHLAACAECREELAVMQKHSRVVRALRAPDEVEPTPGFYARVLERIEIQRPASIWSIFAQSFGQRIAVASMAFALMLGVYLFSTEGDAMNETAFLPGEDQPGLVLGSTPDQERGTVLVNLVTYKGQ